MTCSQLLSRTGHRACEQSAAPHFIIIPTVTRFRAFSLPDPPELPEAPPAHPALLGAAPQAGISTQHSLSLESCQCTRSEGPQRHVSSVQGWAHRWNQPAVRMARADAAAWHRVDRPRGPCAEHGGRPQRARPSSHRRQRPRQRGWPWALLAVPCAGSSAASAELKPSMCISASFFSLFFP